MSDISKKRILKAIEKYQTTGKLPRDWDTVEKAFVNGREFHDLAGDVADKGAYESEDAGLFSEAIEEFLDSLTEHERKVYDLVMVGGMLAVEVSKILGVNESRISQLSKSVRTKAKKIIDTQKMRLKRAEIFFNL